jgi:RNA polymerase sigma-70 factor (ECF subfamily)
MACETDWEQLMIVRLTAGDPSALAALYDRFAGFVFGLARKVTRDQSLAEEVTNDVFGYLWEHPGRVDLGRGSIRSFLGTIAHRRSVDRIRANEATRRRLGRYALGQDLDADRATDIAEQVVASAYADQVRRAVAELSEPERTPILLAYFEGCTYREVADRLGIPEGTAKSRIRKGLSVLGQALNQEMASA